MVTGHHGAPGPRVTHRVVEVEDHGREYVRGKSMVDLTVLVHCTKRIYAISMSVQVRIH